MNMLYPCYRHIPVFILPIALFEVVKRLFGTMHTRCSHLLVSVTFIGGHGARAIPLRCAHKQGTNLQKERARDDGRSSAEDPHRHCIFIKGERRTRMRRRKRHAVASTQQLPWSPSSRTSDALYEDGQIM